MSEALRKTPDDSLNTSYKTRNAAVASLKSYLSQGESDTDSDEYKDKLQAVVQAQAEFMIESDTTFESGFDHEVFLTELMGGSDEQPKLESGLINTLVGMILRMATRLVTTEVACLRKKVAELEKTAERNQIPTAAVDNHVAITANEFRDAAARRFDSGLARPSLDSVPAADSNVTNESEMAKAQTRIGSAFSDFSKYIKTSEGPPVGIESKFYSLRSEISQAFGEYLVISKGRPPIGISCYEYLEIALKACGMTESNIPLTSIAILDETLLIVSRKAAQQQNS